MMDSCRSKGEHQWISLATGRWRSNFSLYFVSGENSNQTHPGYIRTLNMAEDSTAMQKLIDQHLAISCCIQWASWPTCAFPAKDSSLLPIAEIGTASHQPVACKGYFFSMTSGGTFLRTSTTSIVDIAQHTLHKVSTLLYWHPWCRFIGVKSGSRKLIGRDEVWHLHFLLDPTSCPCTITAADRKWG